MITPRRPATRNSYNYLGWLTLAPMDEDARFGYRYLGLRQALTKMDVALEFVSP
jgi:hypothetical protein